MKIGAFMIAVGIGAAVAATAASACGYHAALNQSQASGGQMTTTAMTITGKTTGG